MHFSKPPCIPLELAIKPFELCCPGVQHLSEELEAAEFLTLLNAPRAAAALRGQSPAPRCDVGLWFANLRRKTEVCFDKKQTIRLNA